MLRTVGGWHVTQTELASDPSGPDYTDTAYDGEGLVWKQSNPYRSTGDPTYGLTTTAYDALGRVTSIMHPDGNRASTTYSGNCSTSTDEANEARKSCSDGLGRLTDVYEDPSGLNYHTQYTYDAFDNMLSVNEHGQGRTFLYDSLSRETSAANPELNGCAITYSYDANGNIASKVAPASDQTNCGTKTTTAYTYDALNRLASKSYSDSTPSVSFFYDSSESGVNNWLLTGLANTDGRVSTACTGGAPATCSSASTAVIYSYDAMGRITNYWQCTPYNCGSSAWQMTYNYDLAGDVTSYRHPEGWTVTNTVNNAQQITQVQSSWVDSTHPQYLAQNITYTPWGAEQTLTNGCAGSGCTNAVETYIYNNRLQPVRIELGDSGNPTADYCLVYNYYTSVGNPSSCATPSQGATGDNGTVIGLFDQDNANSSLSHTGAYTYDGLNRLTNAVGTGNSTYNLTFAYDPFGNMSCQINGQTNGYCASR